ncbi:MULTISPECIES: hypothetical protein [Gordonia]|uniref:hypothetical protein n=1 Tax=Gordonia TaxID=2053 RepID=UPI00257D5DF7|nr:MULTISPECIES: hypothetical protein [Gordonia]
MTITSTRTTGSMYSALPVERLTTDDDLFVRMEHALGLGVVNQCVWQLPTRLDEEAFARLGERLCAGRASRLVARRPPPIRDAWRYTPTAGSVEFFTDKVNPEDVAAWIDTQARFALNSVSGPSWRLSAAHSDGIGTYVSFTAAHAIGDGATLITAIMEALSENVYATDVEMPDLASDLSDGVKTAARAAHAAASSVVASLRTGLPRGSAHTQPEHARPRTTVTTAAPTNTGATTGTEPGLPPSVIVTVDREHASKIATERNGTPNSLFVAVMVGLLDRAGMASSGDIVPVSIPVSRHRDDDRRANATTGVTAHIRLDVNRYTDLSEIRDACKAAYRTLDAQPGPMAAMSTVAQALTDGAVRRLAGGMSTPLCVASNVGRVDPLFASLGTGGPGVTAMRAVTTDSAGLAGHAGGISGWLCSGDEVLTLAVSSLNPAMINDRSSLRALVAAEFASWNISETDWGTCE